LNFSENFNRKHVFVFAAGWLGEWAGLLPLQESWLASCITIPNIQKFGIARNSSSIYRTPDTADSEKVSLKNVLFKSVDNNGFTIKQRFLNM
jgi:hypothetical protein